MKLNLQRLMDAEATAKRREANLVETGDTILSDMSSETDRSFDSPLDATGETDRADSPIDTVDPYVLDVVEGPSMHEDPMSRYLQECAEAIERLASTVKEATDRWKASQEYEQERLVPAYRDVGTAIKRLAEEHSLEPDTNVNVSKKPRQTLDSTPLSSRPITLSMRKNAVDQRPYELRYKASPIRPSPTQQIYSRRLPGTEKFAPEQQEKKKSAREDKSAQDSAALMDPFAALGLADLGIAAAPSAQVSSSTASRGKKHANSVPALPDVLFANPKKVSKRAGDPSAIPVDRPKKKVARNGVAKRGIKPPDVSDVDDLLRQWTTIEV